MTYLSDLSNLHGGRYFFLDKRVIILYHSPTFNRIPLSFPIIEGLEDVVRRPT